VRGEKKRGLDAKNQTQKKGSTIYTNIPPGWGRGFDDDDDERSTMTMSRVEGSIFGDHFMCPVPFFLDSWNDFCDAQLQLQLQWRASISWGTACR
jgi:hypothetical protein